MYLPPALPNAVLIGHAVDHLRTLPADCIQTVVTSPPYWGLRNYSSERSLVWANGWVGQLGQELEVEDYIQHLVEIFQEVRRVLRKDGVLWLNLGDSYVDKKLVGVPWRVAFALQHHGWILRSEIVWHKTAGMPENLSDRPTNAWEPIFLFTKSETYYYDSEAVRSGSGGNLRNVWTFPPTFYRGPHSAVFPPDLPRRCIRLSTSEEGACGACGAPLARELERISERDSREGHPVRYGDVGNQSSKGHGFPHLDPPVYRTLGWKRTCKCQESSIVPCMVLDPFAGSGTTLQEAYANGRGYVGIEVNAASLPEINQRLETVSPKAAIYRARRAGVDV